jgi:hypothetical protein
MISALPAWRYPVLWLLVPSKVFSAIVIVPASDPGAGVSLRYRVDSVKRWAGGRQSFISRNKLTCVTNARSFPRSVP